MIIRLFITIILSVLITSCSLWSHQSNDFKIKEISLDEKIKAIVLIDNKNNGIVINKWRTFLGNRTSDIKTVKKIIDKDHDYVLSELVGFGFGSFIEMTWNDSLTGVQAKALLFIFNNCSSSCKIIEEDKLTIEQVEESYPGMDNRLLSFGYVTKPMKFFIAQKFINNRTQDESASNDWINQISSKAYKVEDETFIVKVLIDKKIGFVSRVLQPRYYFLSKDKETEEIKIWGHYSPTFLYETQPSLRGILINEGYTAWIK